MDVARQLLDELMGRNRNLDPSVKTKELNWEDEEVRSFVNYVRVFILLLIVRIGVLFSVLYIFHGQILSARIVRQYAGRFGPVRKVTR